MSRQAESHHHNQEQTGMSPASAEIQAEAEAEGHTPAEAPAPCLSLQEPDLYCTQPGIHCHLKQNTEAGCHHCLNTLA